MSNDLQELMSTMILPAALPVLREACVMPNLVATNFSSEVFEKNETIRVPLPVDMGFADDMDEHNGSKSADLEAGKVDVSLNLWRYKQFTADDKEMREAVMEGVLPRAAQSAIRSLANSFDQEIWGLYKDIPYFSGTAGVTPNTIQAISAVRKIMQENLAPTVDRRMVLDTTAETEYLALLSDFSKSGSSIALEEAQLGMKLGFNFYADQLAPLHTFGTFGAPGATPKVLSGIAGANFIDLTGGAGTETLVKGDLFTIDNVFKPGTRELLPFLVLANNVAASGDMVGVSIFPRLPVTVPLNTNIKVVAPAALGSTTYTISLAFCRDAFLIAMRALAQEATEISTISVATDPVTGMPLRLETWRDARHSSRIWRFDSLFGVRTLRRELACRFHG